MLDSGDLNHCHSGDVTHIPLFYFMKGFYVQVSEALSEIRAASDYIENVKNFFLLTIADFLSLNRLKLVSKHALKTKLYALFASKYLMLRRYALSFLSRTRCSLLQFSGRNFSRDFNSPNFG